MMDEEPDSLPLALGIAALIAAVVAWAPTVGFAMALGAAVSDQDGQLACALDGQDGYAFAASIATGLFAVVASLLAVVALVRASRGPSVGGVFGSIVALALGGSAFFATPLTLFLWGVFNDNLCWSKHIVIGRPLRVNRHKVFADTAARADWTGPGVPVTPGSGAEAARQAATWTRVGHGEHAAVGAFARLVLDLLAHGAPPALIRRTLEAALDEVRHAEDAYAIASAHAGSPVGPGKLAMPDATPLHVLVEETWEDGVLGERESTRVMREQAMSCDDPAVAAILSAAAADEDRHADLAEAVVAWARTLPAAERAPAAPRGATGDAAVV